MPWAISWYWYSFPVLRSGSPQHFSSGPRTPKETPAFCMIAESDLATFLFRSSREATQPTQYRTSTSFFRRLLYIEALGPFEPLALAHAVRVEARLQVLVKQLQLRRHLAQRHDQVPADLEGLVEGGDRDRAVDLAREAGRARPAGLLLDYLIEKPFLILHACGRTKPLALQVLDQLLRRERLLAQVGGAPVLAPAAARAGVQVEDLPPGEAVYPVDAELLGSLEIGDRGDCAPRASPRRP